MNLDLPFGTQSFSIAIDEARADVLVASARDPAGTNSWEEVVAQAMSSPVGASPMSRRIWAASELRSSQMIGDAPHPHIASFR